MIQVLFHNVSFLCWTVLSMITSDNVVEDALRTSAANYTVGIQHVDSLQSVEHVRGEAKSSACWGQGGIRT